MAELEGKTLDRYDLRRIIGKGGMANVYEAYDPAFHRAVAIKVFKREDEDMLRRFIREANVMAKLHHPHLIAIYDTGECLLDGITRYYIVMPLLTGGTLRARIRRAPLSLAEVCQCLRDIGDALDYIHAQGIVHRDIKASNVLLNEEGRCYLTDFGIARITTGDATQLTGTGDVLGTVDYVAPELFEVHRRADARSDLYSLGVLLYEMVTGRLPFSADSQLALISMHVSKRPPSPLLYVPQLPQEVAGVMYRALEKRPEMRYGSAMGLADAFCRAVQRGESEAAVLAAGTSGASATGSASASQKAEGRAAPLAGGTEAFPYVPPVSPSPPISPISPAPDHPPETPLPVPLKREAGARGGRPRSRRVLVLTLLMVSILFIASVAAVYAVFRQTISPTPTPTRVVQGSVTAGGASPSSTSSQGSLTPNPTQTAQAAATAAARATATSIARATATANAQASATVGPLQTATSGNPDYQDSLTDPNNPATVDANWDANSQCFFAGDGYHVTQPASGTYFKGCREHNKTYANLALTADVTILSGHSGGVFFRLKTNLIGNYDGYLFEIDSQGNAKISYEQGSGINTLQDWTPTPLLQRGYQVTNHLQLIARGATLTFYINGKFLTQIQNDYETAASTIGFLATASQGGSAAEVVYSNLKVYALP